MQRCHRNEAPGQDPGGPDQRSKSAGPLHSKFCPSGIAECLKSSALTCMSLEVCANHDDGAAHQAPYSATNFHFVQDESHLSI